MEAVPANVYFVGPRYRHYAQHSGYEMVATYCGAPVGTPLDDRYLSGRLGKWPLVGDLGWRLDSAATRLVGSRLYGAGVLAIELAAGMHMLSRRRSLYHVLYGETDAWLLRHLRRVSNHRLVASFHEPIPRLEWLRLERIVSRLDAAFPVSESQRAYFEQHLPSDRIFVVPHGVDTEFFRPAVTLSPEAVCITVGSTLRDFKTLTDAISLMRADRPNVRILAVGTTLSGGNKSQLSDSRVENLNRLSDEALRSAYQRSRVAVFAFEQATANNSLLEAMACGLPVVATDIGGVREYVGDRAGLFASPGDAAALANAVVRVLDDESLALRMSRASRAQALMFSYPAVATQMSQAHTKLLTMAV